jgi:DNA-binding transcriptional ArsR family regulator
VQTYQAHQADGWTALGDPTRRAIFERLAERPQPVGELARELPVSRPAVSQHLRVLKEARLVVDQPAGNRRIYRLDPDGLGAMRADLERFWSGALAAYKAVVEQQRTRSREPLATPQGAGRRGARGRRFGRQWPRPSA